MSKKLKKNVPQLRFPEFEGDWTINWKKYNEATGVPSLNTSSINNIEVVVATDVKEQEKIANFLTAIDHKIEAISRQIEECDRFKQGLLQKLFV
jgi:type I restriction enzyme S subunit